MFFLLMTKEGSVKVIKALHSQEGGFDVNVSSSNSVWSKIVGSSNFLNSNAIIPNDYFRFRVGCGSSTRFWKDLWTGNSPLYLCYNRLFRLDRDKDCLIKDCFIDNVWTWNWSRSFMGARNAAHLCDLITDITPFELSTDRDVCFWNLSSDGLFSVSSARQVIDSRLLPSLDRKTQWEN
ncbi:hypothetical protein Tco_1242120 [Tanacetum coccineum]